MGHSARFSSGLTSLCRLQADSSATGHAPMRPSTTFILSAVGCDYYVRDESHWGTRLLKPRSNIITLVIYFEREQPANFIQELRRHTGRFRV